MNSKIRDMRHWPLELIFLKLNQMLVGYYHYYGITDNYECLALMRRKIERMLFYWLNRRSNKRSYTWKGFSMLLMQFPLAVPRIYVSIYR